MARLVYQPNIALYYYMKLFSKNLKLDILSLIYESFVSADGKITTRTGGCLRWTGHYCSDGGLSLLSTAHRTGEDRTQADISPGPGASPGRWRESQRATVNRNKLPLV